MLEGEHFNQVPSTGLELRCVRHFPDALTSPHKTQSERRTNLARMLKQLSLINAASAVLDCRTEGGAMRMDQVTVVKLLCM